MSKKFRAKLLKYIPFASKKYLFKLKLYCMAPWLIFTARKPFKSTAPTIVLLSFPRSGSSWIGSILGTGAHVRYLREPITTNYTLKKPNQISVFEQAMCSNWQEYQNDIHNSLASKPDFPYSVIAFPKQWKKTEEDKATVIKEVNPLIIENYLENKASLIYLVRHPFSVAKSYSALKWQPKDVFSKKFAASSLQTIKSFQPNILDQSFYFQMGYLQGWIEALVKVKLNQKNNTESVPSYSTCQLVRYEDICVDAENEFSAIFQRHNLAFSASVKKELLLSLSAKKSIEAGDFSLKRNKAELTKIKVTLKQKSNYEVLMTAYQQAFVNYCSLVTPLPQTLIKLTPSYLTNCAMVEFEKDKKMD